MTLSRVIGITTKEFYTKKFGFEVLGDNIKVFYKARVALSRLDRIASQITVLVKFTGNPGNISASL